MPRADQATIDLLTDYFDAMEAKDFDRLGSYYADNITLTFANAPTITGRDAMLEQMTTLLGKVKSLAHPLINVWQEDGGVIIFEVTSIWRLHDDSEIKINACSIFTLVDGKFTDQRIYVDNAPVNPVPQLTRRTKGTSWLASSSPAPPKDSAEPPPAPCSTTGTRSSSTPATPPEPPR